MVDIGQIQKLNYWESNQIGGFEVSINDYNKIEELGYEIDYEVGQNLIAQTVKEVNPTIFS